jgi:hypothetical protein
MVSMSGSPPTTIIPASEQHAVSSVAGLGFGSSERTAAIERPKP